MSKFGPNLPGALAFLEECTFVPGYNSIRRLRNSLLPICNLLLKCMTICTRLQFGGPILNRSSNCLTPSELSLKYRKPLLLLVVTIRNLNGLSSRWDDVWNNRYGSSWQTSCIMKTNPLLFSLFLFLSFGTKMPYLQIISPDLSVTVFVTLHSSSFSQHRVKLLV
jgi:hypothetical protein